MMFDYFFLRRRFKIENHILSRFFLYWGNLDKKRSFYIFALLSLVFFVYQLSDYKILLYLTLCVVISDQFCLWVFKKNIRRFRPKTWLEWGPDEEIKKTHRYYFEKYTGYSARSLSSMCSSHAANYFGQAILLHYFIPSYALLFYSVAALVSIGRWYIGAHWVSDVLMGWFVGLGTAYLCINYIVPFLEQVL